MIFGSQGEQQELFRSKNRTQFQKTIPKPHYHGNIVFTNNKSQGERSSKMRIYFRKKRTNFFEDTIIMGISSIHFQVLRERVSILIDKSSTQTKQYSHKYGHFTHFRTSPKGEEYPNMVKNNSQNRYSTSIKSP